MARFSKHKTRFATKVGHAVRSLKKQWHENWLSILIEAIIAIAVTIIGFYLAYAEWSQKNTPLFKYSYDKSSRSVNIDLGSDFLPIATIWWVPGKNATSTGLIKNSLGLEDLTDAVAYSDISESQNPLDENWKAYIRCVLLDEFSAQGTSTLRGFPVMAETRYVLRGHEEVRENYDLLLLRGFSQATLQILTIPIRKEEGVDYLLGEGNQKLGTIQDLLPYDIHSQYLDEGKNCRQVNEMYIGRSLIDRAAW